MKKCVGCNKELDEKEGVDIIYHNKTNTSYFCRDCWYNLNQEEMVNKVIQSVQREKEHSGELPSLPEFWWSSKESE
jgi:hypothetical protein